MGFLIFVVDVGTSAHEARFELFSTQALLCAKDSGSQLSAV